MARGGDRAVIEQVHRLFSVGSVAGLSEGQLLERFLSRRDEVAFAALVARHGPMVLGVCRRLLADAHDVEDAFQATFLVLVRKAGSLKGPDLLEHWLYRVAYRVAVRARANAFRRRARERQGLSVLAESESEGRAEGNDLADLKAVLDREVGRLPEKYRSAVVLCYFKGCSNEEAARRLGCPVGTVRSRLARARERLHRRLTRLGLAPSAALLGAVLTPEHASAAASCPLIESTVRAALMFRAGRVAAVGVVPASVLTLADGVLQTMFLTKLKLIAGGLLVLGVFATGAGVLGQQQPAAEPAAAEPSRLKEVERKIDRLLKVLEGQPPAGTPATDHKVPPERARPEASPYAPGDVKRDAGNVQSGNLPLESGSMMSRFPRSDSDRLGNVERRLEQVERKLDQVIRQIGGLKSEDTAPRVSETTQPKILGR